MVFHILTIFPEFFEGPFRHGVVANAAESGLIEIRIHDLRTWTRDRHRTVDDRPFGGEERMLDCPQYTRPADFRGWKVPEVLLSGNHEEIRRWRETTARAKTAKHRPDLLQ